MDINQLNERLALCRASVTKQDSQYFDLGGCIVVRDVDGELLVGYGTMALAKRKANTKYGLDTALYYEIYKQGKLESCVYNDYDRICVLGGAGFFNAEALYGTPTPANATPLWWEIERDEKRAAFERMIALRNDVRRICGQGGDV